VREVEGKKFSEVYSEEFLPAHGNLRLERILATQQVLGQKVEADSSRYYRWCLAMLGPLVSGVALDMFDQGYKGKYTEIAKMFGFPFGAYVNNVGAQRELVTLFDAVTSADEFKQVGNKPKKFSDAVKVDTNTKNSKRHRDIYTSMETRWLDYGKQLMDKLQDYNFLFTLVEQKKAVGLQQQRNQFEVPALENYINHGVLNTDTERIQNITAESIIYEKHMFSLSP